MRRRRSRSGDDGAEVALSPLIDCVFLLLIFFLVTSILKRKEKQIQVDLPDNTASVSAETAEEQIVIGLDRYGNPLVPAATRDKDGSYLWEPVADLSGYNGIRPEDKLRAGEVIALPYRVAEPSAATGGTGVVTAPSNVDIAALAGNAIDDSSAASPRSRQERPATRSIFVSIRGSPGRR